MRLFWHQLRWEQLVFWRSREAAVFVFLFPLLLFALLTAVYNGTIYGAPGIMGAARRACSATARANTAFAGLALLLVGTPRARDPEADPRDAAADRRHTSTAVLVSIMIVFTLQTVVAVSCSAGC